MLGRPGQYIEKVNFADLRLYQSDENNLAGGSIEIFENEKDCQNRVDYLKKVSQESPFIEYNCMYDNILLRLNEKLKRKSLRKRKLKNCWKKLKN